MRLDHYANNVNEMFRTDTNKRRKKKEEEGGRRKKEKRRKKKEPRESLH